ncbi:hypothetical protein THIOM_005038, partial [Candidatus Thiomargarita nelsonii]
VSLSANTWYKYYYAVDYRRHKIIYHRISPLIKKKLISIDHQKMSAGLLEVPAAFLPA